jgi:hypothetical protein
MKLDFFQQIFKKDSNIHFYQNQSGGSRVFSCGQTDGQRDMTKLIVAYRNFANAPENWDLVFVITHHVQVILQPVRRLDLSHYLYTAGLISNYI